MQKYVKKGEPNRVRDENKNQHGSIPSRKYVRGR